MIMLDSVDAHALVAKVPNKKKSNKPRDKLALPPCKICSGEATGLHYGIHTCEACKAFFRRAVAEKTKYACTKENDCEILDRKRGNCSACRLQKCLDQGMSRDAVKQGRYTIAIRTNTILEVKRLARKATEESSDSNTCPSPVLSASSVTSQSELEQRSPASVIPDSPAQSPDSSLPPKKKARLRLSPIQSTLPEEYLYDISVCSNSCGSDSAMTEREIQCLIQVLVKAHDSIYPHFKQYFRDDFKKKLEEQFMEERRIEADMFGIRNLLSKAEFNTVYHATGIDVDGRLGLLRKLNGHRERSLMKYIMFAKTIEGFNDLSMSDKQSLIKGAKYEYWILGHYTHYNEKLDASIGAEIQITYDDKRKIFGDWSNTEEVNMFVTLQKLNLSYQEVVILRGIVIFSRDRNPLENPEKVEAIQWKLMQCLKYLTEVSHPKESRRLTKNMDILVNLRNLTENKCKRKGQYEDYYIDAMKEFPLLLEVLDN